MLRPIHLNAVLLLVGSLLSTAARAGTCETLLPPARPPGGPARAVTAPDLIELRDIGNAGVTGSDSPIAVSPDGMSAAFQIRRANIASNGYCLAMFVMPTDGHKPPRQVDSGGEPIAYPGYWQDAVTSKISGYLLPIEPQWSPDGLWIAYLRKDQGIVQLWRARADGSGALPVTRSPIDVVDYQWSQDGSGLLYRLRPEYRRLEKLIRLEGLRGYNFDDRAMPEDGSAPMVIDREKPQVWVADLATGRDLPLGSQPGSALSWQEIRGEMESVAADGRVASIIAADPTDIVSDHVIEISSPPSGKQRCGAPECHGRLGGVWWLPNSDTVLFLRQEGWANETSAIYRWRVGTSHADPVFRSEALLTGCRMAGDRLLCMSESALEPRRIVSFDPRDGRQRLIFDPNPEFHQLRLGTVRRLRWKTALGLEAFGDLVLPSDHPAGARLPLVVTQYQSRGFLRGGTGDAYPIQLFAAHGYAVLSTQEPREVGTLSPVRTATELNRRNVVGEANARNVLSSIETGVAAVLETGLVDPSKIAITGLSDGAAKARYAILHSRIFATALISSCCDEPASDAMLGPVGAAERASYGWPMVGDATAPYWSGVSLLARAADFDTPLLIQATDHEYLTAVATVTALQQHGKPVDLFIFPNEYHVLVEPAHRAAAYQRDLDWLDIWLKGLTPAVNDDARRLEIRRWIEMRSHRLARAVG